MLTHNFTPELCMEYFVRLTLTLSNCMDGVSTLVLTHNVTPKLCTDYFVRLTVTNLDWVLPCDDTQFYP